MPAVLRHPADACKKKRLLGFTPCVLSRGLAVLLIEDGLPRLRFPRLWMPVLLVVATLGSGCGEVRGRKKVREGNQLFRDGKYAEAVQRFEEAEALVPDLWVLWLNKGLACRQLMIPGAKTPANEKAIDCALDAFDKVRKTHDGGNDQRGDQLYVQTLFDGDRFDALVAMYNQKLQKQPNDLLAINGLIQVYAKWNKVQDALHWYVRRAELQAQDAEAQYGVGVFLWQQLFQRGGGPDKAAYDPRPTPEELAQAAKAKGSSRHKEKKEPPAPPRTPPSFAVGDLTGEQRLRLADAAIAYLKKAVSLRPKYSEAMTYLNLIYRQKSYALFDKPTEWQECINEAERWRKEAMAAQGRATESVAAAPGPATDAGAP